jgi:hypothetical protein
MGQDWWLALPLTVGRLKWVETQTRRSNKTVQKRLTNSMGIIIVMARCLKD